LLPNQRVFTHQISATDHFALTINRGSIFVCVVVDFKEQFFRQDERNKPEALADMRVSVFWNCLFSVAPNPGIGR